MRLLGSTCAIGSPHVSGSQPGAVRQLPGLKAPCAVMAAGTAGLTVNLCARPGCEAEACPPGHMLPPGETRWDDAYRRPWREPRSPGLPPRWVHRLEDGGWILLGVGLCAHRSYADVQAPGTHLEMGSFQV